MEITKFITKSLLIRRLQFDLPHANDARVLLGYCADRMTERSVDGTRLCTAHVDVYFPRNYPEVTCSATPANMLTLGQRRQTLALERQRRRRVTTLAQRRLAMSQDDANPTSGDDVGSTLFRRRLATSMDDAKPTSGDDVGSTLFRRRLATSQYDAKTTSGDDVGSTLFPRR